MPTRKKKTIKKSEEVKGWVLYSGMYEIKWKANKPIAVAIEGKILPINRQIKHFPRCNALDSNGKQCKRHSAITMNYHGEGELYKQNFDKNEVGWVKVNLCPEHYEGAGGKYPIKK